MATITRGNSVHRQVLIVGGGSAGIFTAARLKRSNPSLDIAIVEPSEFHWYQPAWTLVGAGAYDLAKTRRPMRNVIPRGVTWIRDRVEALDPANNAVRTQASGTISYDYLVMCPGLEYDLDGIEGLRAALDTDVVCSNYIDPEKTWRVIRGYKGGNALFTQPTTPIKCGGAPQKIMYLADDAFRRQGVRSKGEVIFATPGSVIFGVKEYAETLMQVVARKGIHFRPFYAPVRIDTDRQEVHFTWVNQQSGCIVQQGNPIAEAKAGETTAVIPYTMLHLAPPQRAPGFVRASPLVHADGPLKGWMNVDLQTLQHREFPNIFGLGDVAGLPTAKTGAAVRKQAPVVVDHLLSLIASASMGRSSYNGYSSCPLVTGYGKMVLAEFKYDNVRDSDPLLSRFVDTTKENWSMWLLKKYGLPWLYWHRMMHGKM